jgi:type IV secretory pathway VirJ component
MKIKKPLLLSFFLVATFIALWLLRYMNPPVFQETVDIDRLSDITVAEPLWGSQGLTVVFVNTGKYPANGLARRLAEAGVTAAVVNIWHVVGAFDPDDKACLGHTFITTTVSEIQKQLTLPAGKHLIIAGIGEGALVPFVNAQTIAGNDATNLSVGFSVDLSTDLALCPPLSIHNQDQDLNLVSTNALKSNWRSVWTDEPDDKTGVFIKKLGKVDTRIASYDTPLDTVLVEEVKASLGQTKQLSLLMPVVEVPVAKPSTNVTIFYSGDGGWRDLDRTVACEMAALNYPVVGVDVLRYFWERKTPEQAAADLSATMAYYRKHWGTKTFVLAGYSFGADIMPAIYNRLPAQDKDSVVLLVLIALAKSADFEIHVTGWLGQSAGEMPLAPELAQIPKAKILCIYGIEEKADTACTVLSNSEGTILELPGGHHFDQDYPKLTRQILDVYHQHGLN